MNSLIVAIECLFRKYWIFLVQNIFARFNCDEHFLNIKLNHYCLFYVVKIYFSKSLWRFSTCSFCFSTVSRIKFCIEFVKLVNEYDNLSKPFAPLINSLTISVNIWFLDRNNWFFGETIEWSSTVDDTIEQNDTGDDACCLNSLHNGFLEKLSLKIFGDDGFLSKIRLINALITGILWILPVIDEAVELVLLPIDFLDRRRIFFGSLSIFPWLIAISIPMINNVWYYDLFYFIYHLSSAYITQLSKYKNDLID